MVTIQQVNDVGLTQYREALASLLQNVVDDGASIGFLRPMDRNEALAYWDEIHIAVHAGDKLLLVAMVDDVLVGTAQLNLKSLPNGKHRAEIQKIMVHTAYRRRGIAHQLIDQLDMLAKSAGRTLLILDTRQGDPAEALYRQHGYQQAGVIPQFAQSPDGGNNYDATVLYYKIIGD